MAYSEAIAAYEHIAPHFKRHGHAPLYVATVPLRGWDRQRITVTAPKNS
jgi:hypothetical protein